MRRYTLTINGNEHVIDVEELTATTFQVVVGGRTIDVELRTHESMTQSEITPAIAGPVQPPPMASAAADADLIRVRPAPPPPSSAPRVVAQPPVRQSSGGATSALLSPMPGVIHSITTTVGAQVKRGDVLLVLEAMKMKNSLRANFDGTVAEILVKPQDQVRHGDTLIRFDEAGA